MHDFTTHGGFRVLAFVAFIGLSLTLTWWASRRAQGAAGFFVAGRNLSAFQNGLALSSTVHWLFDRHLISLTDDYGLLVSHNKVPAELRGLFAKQLDRIRLPDDPRLWPHRSYIARHREAFSSA